MKTGFAVRWRARPDLPGSVWESEWRGRELRITRKSGTRDGVRFYWDGGNFIVRCNGRKIATAATPLLAMAEVDDFLLRVGALA